MIMDPAVLPIAAAALVPILVYVMWTDLKSMRIPNAACLLVLLVFLPTGLAGLPIETFGWRLLHTAVAFFAGYAIFQATGGRIGAGDLKLAIAFTPFVPGVYLGLIAQLYVATSLLTVALFLALRAGLRGRTALAALETRSESVMKVPFPFAWTLSSTFIAYLLLVVSGAA
jgi:prepilin peptidase CpaA